MPPKKVQKTAAAEAAAAETPQKAHFARLKAVQTRTGAKGAILVVGIPRGEDSDDSEDEDEEDEEEEKEDTKTYTAEQVSTLRHILINDARDKSFAKGYRIRQRRASRRGFHDGKAPGRPPVY
jgi:hypothetical protein